MSVNASSWAWRQELPMATKLVLLALADYADDVGFAWPSLNTLARQCGTDRGTVLRHLERLVARGLIVQRYRDYRDSGANTSTRYRLGLVGENHKPLVGDNDNPCDSHLLPLSLSPTPLVGDNDNPCDSHLLQRDPSSNRHVIRQGTHDRVPSDTRSEGINEEASARKRASPSTYPPEFEMFWTTYPRKLCKRHAFAVWLKRVKSGLSPPQIVLAAQHYARYCEREGTEERYILHPTTFLGPQRRYEDFLDGVPESARRGDGGAHREHPEPSTRRSEYAGFVGHRFVNS